MHPLLSVVSAPQVNFEVSFGQGESVLTHFDAAMLFGVQKKRREEAERLRREEEERLRKEMEAEAARKEAERRHQVRIRYSCIGYSDGAQSCLGVCLPHLKI